MTFYDDIPAASDGSVWSIGEGADGLAYDKGITFQRPASDGLVVQRIWNLHMSFAGEDLATIVIENWRLDLPDGTEVRIKRDGSTFFVGLPAGVDAEFAWTPLPTEEPS